MVAVLHSAPEVAAPEALAAWTERVSEGFTPDERVTVLATLDTARSLYADRCAPDGEPWLDRALAPLRSSPASSSTSIRFAPR
jgi:hypothetical protein